MYVNFIFFHKTPLNTLQGMKISAWIFGTLVYWCTGALHCWCRNGIPSKNSPSYLELFLAVKFKRLTDI